MLQRSPKQIVESFWKAFTSKQVSEAVHEHMTEDCEFVMPGAPPMKGAAQICPMFEAYLGALPDFSAQTVHAIESGETYAAETRFSGTHKGPLHTPHGSLPASGRRVGWQSADIIRVRDGKIASWHVYHDPNSLLEQFGIARG